MSTDASDSQSLFTFEFWALCLLIFVAYGNVSVYYGLYQYVSQIGVPQQWRGLIVGISNLATIVCCLLATPYLTMRLAPRTTYAGIILLFLCGVSFLFVHDTLGLLLVRMVNGAGVYLLSASSMTRLVSIIPPGRSGQAFGLYSTASLLPFSLVPGFFDWLVSDLGAVDRGYALMALVLVPCAAMNYLIDRRGWRPRRDGAVAQAITFAEMAANVRKPSIGMLLIVNTVYSITFASVFFLSKGLFNERGVENVGVFYGIQTCFMIATRVLGNRIFDRLNKLFLVRLGYALTALAFAMIAWSESLGILYCAAVVLGLGMGFGVPSLNGLMFGLSDPRYRAANTNLMMMSVHTGNLCGPILGNVAVGLMGYVGLMLVGMVVNLGGILLSFGIRCKGSGRSC